CVSGHGAGGGGGYAVGTVGIEHRVQRHDHAVLATAAELRTLHAVGEDLLEQPRVGHDGKAHAAEIAGRVCEGAQLLEPRAAGAPPQLVHDHHTDARAAGFRVDRERPHLGHMRTERRELRASDNRAPPDRNDEAARMHRQFAERTRQEMPFLQVRLDEGVDLPGVLLVRGAQGDATRCRSSHAEAPTAASGASRRFNASSASASVMTSGGSRRTTRSAVRLTTTPRSSAAGTTAPASRVSSTPHMRPAPRTSFTIACFAASARSRRSNKMPTRLTFSATPPSNSSLRTHSPARPARRLPP